MTTTDSHHDLSDPDRPDVVVRSTTYQARVRPERGMLVQQIVHRATRRRLLWERPDPRVSGSDARSRDDLGPPGPASVARFDQQWLSGGWFVMAPTAGMPFTGADAEPSWLHGEAARVSWRIGHHSDDEVTASCLLPRSGLHIERRVRAEESGLRVDTTLENPCLEPRRVTLGEHPCLAGDLGLGGRVEADVTRAWTPADPAGVTDRLDLPSRLPSPATHTCLQLARPGAVLTGPLGDLELRWSGPALRYAVVWQHLGPTGSAVAGSTVAIEPMSAPGLGLDGLAPEDWTLLEPQDSVSWSMSMSWHPRSA